MVLYSPPHILDRTDHTCFMRLLRDSTYQCGLVTKEGMEYWHDVHILVLEGFIHMELRGATSASGRQGDRQTKWLFLMADYYETHANLKGCKFNM